MILNDNSKTRIRVTGVTSYAPDKGYNYSNSTSWPTIAMTIGSAVIVLKYDSKEVRDADIERLDDKIDSITSDGITL